MGLLDRALKKKKEISKTKPISKLKNEISPQKNIKEIIKTNFDKLKYKRKIIKHQTPIDAKPAKIPRKIVKSKKEKVEEDLHLLKPKVSLSSGKIMLPKKKNVKIDFSELKKNLEKKSKKYTGINFAKVKRDIQEKIETKTIVHNTIVERVATGIPGLDGVMESGFIRKSSILVGGGAGCGKTIFCMQYLINGIDNFNENGIFVSFEQTPEDIKENFERFNWELDKKIKQQKLVILHFTPEEVNKFLESGGGIVRDTIESMNAKRIVIDSLTAFTLLFKDDFSTRKAVLQLFASMAKWGVTTLLTSEQEPDPDKHESTIMEFEVDGVILLYNVRKGDVRERSLEIFKMRATKHSAKIFPLKIEDSGILIYPEENVF